MAFTLYESIHSIMQQTVVLKHDTVMTVKHKYAKTRW